ncbi:MAG TPA: hypothetical protein VK427_00195, partial [Kofleriaceae bacterium]|nr:hypothetical protein [Kofleriaceae bacterium]
MRLRTLSKLLVLGGTVVLAYKHRDRLLGTTARRTNELSPELEPDPSDPVQTFDEAPDLLVSDLSVDAIDAADVEAAQDLATLESDLDATSLDSDVTGQLDFDSAELAVEETGELYGVHTPRAVDNALP